jgi:hypothetical protein
MRVILKVLLDDTVDGLYLKTVKRHKRGSCEGPH